MSYITNLKCRECGQEYPISPLHVCETCFGPLEVTYDYARIRAAISRSLIEKRPHNLWRYRELLPVDSARPTSSVRIPASRRCCIASGLARNSASSISISRTTPSIIRRCRTRTASCRSSITKAREFGFTTVSCASTGNLATAVAAHAARAGLQCYIFMPEGRGGGQDCRLDDLRRQGHHDSRQLRRRQSAVQRDRRQVRLGLRQYQPASVLHRGRKNFRLRGRGAARLAVAGSYRAADRGRHDPAEGRQGI